MRPRTLQHRPDASMKLNVTPLIDVVMVLIVFFLIVGKLAADRSAFVKLPMTSAGDPSVVRGVTVALLPPREGPAGVPEILVEGQPVPLEQLGEALKLRLPELAGGQQQTPVFLRADRSLPYGMVRPVIAACRNAGITSLRLVSGRGEAPGSGAPGSGRTP
jgi:biopolymer transport protein ExbD